MNIKSLAFAYCPSFLRPTLDRIERSPLGYRLAKGVFWSLAGSVISRGLMLLASILIARMLGKDVFGEYGIIRSTTSMFLVFAGLGLGLTATKHVAEFRVSDPQRAGRIMALSGLFAMVTGALIMLGVIAFAPWLASHTINAPHLASELRVGAVTLFISAVNGAQTGALSGLESFRAIAGVNFVVGVASFPILVAGAYYGGLSGSVWALAGNAGLLWLASHVALRREASRHGIPFTFRSCFQEWPVLWKFSLPAGIGGVMVGPVVWASNAFLVNQPDGFGEMGIFNAANQWRVAILFVPAMLSRVVLPMLSSLHGSRDRGAYVRMLKANILLNGGIACALAAAIALPAHWIMRSYGPGFEQGAWVLVCLAFTAVLVAVNSVVGQAITSRGRMWIGLAFNAAWAIVLLAGAFFWVQFGLGAFGLALANLVAYLCHTLWQGVYLHWLIRRHDGEGPSESELVDA